MSSAEQAVIGALLLEGKRLLPNALCILSPADFGDEAYRDVYRAIMEIDTSGGEIDPVTLEGKLGKSYRETMVRAAEQVPAISRERFGDYLRIVSREAKLRRAEETVQSLSFIGTESGALEQWREGLSKAIGFLGDVETEATISAKEGFLRFVETKDNPKKYYQSGMARLDKALKISAGDYIIVGGRPSTGKTAFTLQMMLNMAKRHNVLYFSLETSAEKIFDRLLSNYTETPFEYVKDGKQLIDYWPVIHPKYDTFSKLRFGVVPAAGWTVSQIKAKALQENAEIVFIDYLGLLKGTGSSIYERATSISNDLHIMAQQTGIATVALAQLNRQAGREPSMSDLRDTGAIEQDADAILILTQSDENAPHSRSLYIVKNKEGELSVIDLCFEGKIQRFSERDYIHGHRNAS